MASMPLRQWSRIGLLGFAAVVAHPQSGRGAVPIEGYAWPASVVQGDTVGIYVSSTNPILTIDIMREGATQVLMQRFTDVPAFEQAVPESAWATGCGWAPTLQIPIPDSWPSGIYEAKFIGTTFQGTYAVFTVLENDPGSTGSILFQSSTTTWQAYNNWGGKSLYTHNSTNTERSYAVSYQRPYVAWSGRGQLLDWELQFVRWIEGAGYGVEYCTNVDTHARPDLQSHYELFMSVGHDEYWSKEARDAIESRLADRKNVAIFSGNTCWWQIRFLSDLDSMICYKDKNLDPFDRGGRFSGDRQLVRASQQPPREHPDRGELAEWGVRERPGVAAGEPGVR